MAAAEFDLQRHHNRVVRIIKHMEASYRGNRLSRAALFCDSLRRELAKRPWHVVEAMETERGLK